MLKGNQEIEDLLSERLMDCLQVCLELCQIKQTKVFVPGLTECRANDVPYEVISSIIPDRMARLLSVRVRQPSPTHKDW